ncbi:MAG: ABC transporter substrate-binding protein [Reinekea sp.]
MKNGYLSIFLGFLLLMQHSFADETPPKIGVMLGGSEFESGDLSSAEKLCIIEALKDRARVDIQIYANHRRKIESAEAAQQMIKDKVDLALLPLISDEAIAAADVLRQAGIPYLTSATSDTVIRSANEGLSTFPQNSMQAEALAQYYVDHYADLHRPIAVITDLSSAYSQQLSAQFLAQLRILNKPIEVTEYNIVGDSLFQLPDLSGYVVFAALFNPKIALLYHELRKQGDITILGPDSIGVRTEFLQIIGTETPSNNTDIVFLKNWDGVIKGARSKDFWSVFYQACNRQKEPTFVNAYVYDMAALALEWVISGAEEPPLTKIRNSQQASVISGEPLLFSEQGYRQKEYFFYQYTGGKDAKLLQ